MPALNRHVEEGSIDRFDYLLFAKVFMYFNDISEKIRKASLQLLQGVLICLEIRWLESTEESFLYENQQHGNRTCKVNLQLHHRRQRRYSRQPHLPSARKSDTPIRRVYVPYQGIRHTH